MRDRIFGIGDRRYVWFECRPVYKVRFKPYAHALWAAYFNDCECDSPDDIKFFKDREGIEFDVYSWDNTPGMSTWFFAIDDSDRSLPEALFESFQPEWRKA